MFCNKKIKEKALNTSRRDLVNESNNLEIQLLISCFNGDTSSVKTIQKKMKKIDKTLLFQQSKKYQRVLKRIGKEIKNNE